MINDERCMMDNDNCHHGDDGDDDDDNDDEW